MRLFIIALAALLVAGSSPARAEYPDRAIQIVVPYTPAGTVDLLARALGTQADRRLGTTGRHHQSSRRRRQRRR